MLRILVAIDGRPLREIAAEAGLTTRKLSAAVRRRRELDPDDVRKLARIWRVTPAVLALRVTVPMFLQMLNDVTHRLEQDRG